MQKRLLALVATVAMVLSMFAGVAFAAGEPDEILLNKTKVTSSKGNIDYELITGTVLSEDRLAAGSYTIVVNYVDYNNDPGEENVTLEVPVSNGRFNFYLPTDLEPQDVEVNLKDADALPQDVIIKVRYNVTVTPKLEFPFLGEPKPLTITGKVTNSKGDAMAGESVALVGVDSDHEYFDVTTNSKGEFGFVVLEWLYAEDLELWVADEVHVEGEVAAKSATLKVTPNSGVVHTVTQTAFKVSGSGFAKQAEGVTFTLTKGNANAEMGAGESLPTDIDTTADGKITEFTLYWTPQEAGTYTLTAKAGNYSASATITVVNPANYNLLNSSKLTKLEVKPNNDFLIGTDIELVDHEGNSGNYVYTVYVDGKLAKNVDDPSAPVDFKEQASGTLRIAATKLATHSIRIVVNVVNTVDGAEVVGGKVFDQTYTANVTGWEVEANATELTAGEAHDVTFIVKDKDGKPINNAFITITDELGGEVDSIDPAEYNAQNGTYVFEDVEVDLPGKLTVTFENNDGDAMAVLELDVVGQKVWNVTANIDTLLQGEGEDVELTVTQNGDAVTPWLVKWIYEDGTSSEGVRPTYVDEGIVKVKVNAAQAGELTVRVENIDGTLCGETTIEVVAPKLVLVDEEAVYLTNNFKTKVAFKVVDPRDGSVIDSNLALVSDYLTSGDIEIWDANDGVSSTTILGAEEHVMTILAKADQDAWDAAAEDEEVVAIAFEIDGIRVDGVFEVKDATITSDPEMIIIGAKNNLTLTYEDANGKPIVGKTVKVKDGVTLGKTDDNGQVIYPAGIVAAAVTIEAATDVDAAKVEKTINIGYDFEAPQVTYEVDGNKATIIVTDNVRLVRINLDGKDIDFWPGAKYEYEVTLNPGVNKFRVKAQDSNDNVLDEVVEIEYKTDSIVLKDDKVQRQGDYLFVQARQFEEFGAKFAWNGETRTATFVIGDDKVEVTIGSTTAVVNGEAVTMPVAAFIADGRTYVPVRFVSENLGWNVHWAQGDIVTITLP